MTSPAITLIDSVVASSPPDTFYIDPGLIAGQEYYYRITAKDTAGNESDFSEELCLEVKESSVAQCENSHRRASSGGGGGGGGGCFISATGNYPNKIVNQKAHLMMCLIGFISSIFVWLIREIKNKL